MTSRHLLTGAYGRADLPGRPSDPIRRARSISLAYLGVKLYSNSCMSQEQQAPAQTITLPANVNCLRCGHSWQPRKPVIKWCPKCNSPYWNKPRRKDLAAAQPQAPEISG